MFRDSRDQDGAVKVNMVPTVTSDTEFIRRRYVDRGDQALTRDSCEMPASSAAGCVIKEHIPTDRKIRKGSRKE